MLPAYNLVVDIIAADTTVSARQFHQQVSPCLNYLSDLAEAFRPNPCRIEYYPPDELSDKPEPWAVRGIVLISLGKKRAEHLLRLYAAIARLIEFELPDYEVRHEISQFDFS